MRVKIKTERVELDAELNDSPTAKAVRDASPCESVANTWGEEVYFSVPVSAALEADARQVVAAGSVCFWVEGGAVALPFGPTPISRGDECRLAAKVNVIGKILQDPRALSAVRPGDDIRLEAAQ